jgi:hypothetical protein
MAKIIIISKDILIISKDGINTQVMINTTVMNKTAIGIISNSTIIIKIIGIIRREIEIKMEINTTKTSGIKTMASQINPQINKNTKEINGIKRNNGQNKIM